MVDQYLRRRFRKSSQRLYQSIRSSPACTKLDTWPSLKIIDENQIINDVIFAAFKDINHNRKHDMTIAKRIATDLESFIASAFPLPKVKSSNPLLREDSNTKSRVPAAMRVPKPISVSKFPSKTFSTIAGNAPPIRAHHSFAALRGCRSPTTGIPGINWASFKSLFRIARKF